MLRVLSMGLLLALVGVSGIAVADDAELPSVNPPDPGNPCRPQCRGGLIAMGPPDPGNPCRPQC